MYTFQSILDAIKGACAWEHIPHAQIAALARMSGTEEAETLIRELDRLDDADLENDAGDGIDEYWRLRTSLCETLSQIGEPAVDPLLRGLESSNPQTRAYAALALGKIGAVRACDPIAVLLAKEQDHAIKLSLIEALGYLRDVRAVDLLLPYLKVSEQQNRGSLVRVAANALGRIGTDEAIPVLAELLASDEDWFARLGATEGLGQIRHPLAVEALKRALRDKDSRVSAEAAAGLRRLAASG